MIACCITLFPVLVVYYVVSIIYFVKHKSARRFMLLIGFPLPFAMTLASILFIYGEKLETYETLVRLLIISSVASGMAVLFHCLWDIRKSESFLLIIRLVASFILFLNPLLLYYPSYKWLMISLYLVSGILLGIYGYITYYKGKKHGLLYTYVSIFFMVLAPVISLAIAILYMKYFKDELLYRYTERWVTCHEPGGPSAVDVLGEKAFMYPAIFSFGYLGFLGLLNEIRKAMLERKLMKDGTIPNEFHEIINSKEDKDEEA